MNYTDNLQSPRLTTRFLTQDDVAPWAEFFKDAETTAFHTNPDGLSEVERAQQWCDFTRKRYTDGRYGLQALISRATGEMVGMCGLMTQEVNGGSVIEIGYHLLRQHWGLGYAAEAARLFRDYGFRQGVADELVSVIDPRNERSKRVAMANGMRLVQSDAEFRGGNYNLFRISRDEWEALNDASAT